MGKLSIHVGIDHSDEVDAYHAYYAEVTVAAIVVLARAQEVGEPGTVKVLFFHSGSEEVHIALGGGVVVHDVAVGSGVVAEHCVVP